MMKKWITFDLDGTLMQNPFGKWVFPEVEELISSRLQHPFRSTEALIREHERRMGLNRTVDAYDWDDMVRRLLDELKLDLAIDVEQLVLKHSTAPKIYLLEETVIPTLLKLKELGFSLATVTNGFYKFQYPVMKRLGISGLFDEIVTPELAGCGKPDVGIFRGLQESGQIVAHVGDRLDHDVYLANRSGIPSVLIYRDLPEPLKALEPHKRPESVPFMEICEEKLKAEHPLAATNPFPSAYIPTHVLYRMEELPGCIQSFSSSLLL
jgi:FMN phosphatase YigB (HAD superfamily)